MDKKFHYYVLVVSERGPKFVTKVNYANKTAEWNYEEKPLEMSKERAEDLVLGLCLNFNTAYVVCQPFEIDSHPYNYKDFELTFEEKEEEPETGDEEVQDDDAV